MSGNARRERDRAACVCARFAMHDKALQENNRTTGEERREDVNTIPRERQEGTESREAKGKGTREREDMMAAADRREKEGGRQGREGMGKLQRLEEREMQSGFRTHKTQQLSQTRCAHRQSTRRTRQQQQSDSGSSREQRSGGDGVQ